MKVDFGVVADEMKNSLASYLSAIEKTKSSVSLDEFLRLVLNIGNFLNKVCGVIFSLATDIARLCPAYYYMYYPYLSSIRYFPYPPQESLVF